MVVAANPVTVTIIPLPVANVVSTVSATETVFNDTSSEYEYNNVGVPPQNVVVAADPFRSTITRNIHVAPYAVAAADAKLA
jgi:hypothetical protein